jgi:lysozyme family protein
MAVNSGVRAAILTIQKVVGTTQDGILGPKTVQAIKDMPPSRFVAWFNAERLRFMASLSNWPTFSRGWALRIADNLKDA